MKVLFSFFAFGILTFLSCKKEPAPEQPGFCGTGSGNMPIDTTETVPQHPDAAARVATITYTNTNSAGETFGQRMFYNRAGFLDSVVGTGSEVNTYTRMFTHLPTYTLVRFYNAAGVFNGSLDSIRLNAAGYPTASYKSLNGTMQLISFLNYDTEGNLISRQYNYQRDGLTINTYNHWEAGDLKTFDVSGENSDYTLAYTYFMPAPSMPGEPLSLKNLVEFGRPLKHSLHLRISERKDSATDLTMYVYKWSRCRIVNWTKDGGKTVTATLTYEN